MSIIGKLKEKAKLGLELALIGAASIGWTSASSKAYQEPPAIIQQANQSKPETNAPVAEQEAKQGEEKKDNTSRFIPLYFEQSTYEINGQKTVPKPFLLNIDQVYRVKITKGKNINDDYVKKEQWPEDTRSDSLIGVLFSALNGNKADPGKLISGKYYVFLDADGSKTIMGQTVGDKEKVSPDEVKKLIDKNVYHINGRGGK